MFQWFKNIRRRRRILGKRRFRQLSLKIKYKRAVRRCLVESCKPLGVIIVTPLLNKIERYPRFGTTLGNTRDDFLEGYNWWMIDLKKSFSNIREMSKKEIDEFVESIL